MTAQLDFYRKQAADSRADADAATLANIRDRWLLSEATWMQLADRSARAEKFRETLAAKHAPKPAMIAPGEPIPAP